MNAAKDEKTEAAEDPKWLTDLADQCDAAAKDLDYYKGGMIDAPDPDRLRRIAIRLLHHRTAAI